jgi:hypothetical protein
LLRAIVGKYPLANQPAEFGCHVSGRLGWMLDAFDFTVFLLIGRTAEPIRRGADRQ